MPANHPALEAFRTSMILPTAGPRGRTALVLAFAFTALIVIAGAFLAHMATGLKVHAQQRTTSTLCQASDLHGDWTNIEPDTDGMTRVVIDTCATEHDEEDGTGVARPGNITLMRPFGACSPNDCDWGAETAEDKHDGWIRTIHDFASKTSHVWAKTYEHHGRTYLRLWVVNNFSDERERDDLTTDEWFLKN